LQRNTVAYAEDQPRDDLEKATVLRDAISDLPDVGSLYAVFPFIDGQLL
jgi:DNA (cytosine-5)-methyltransferase 1